MRSEFSLEKMKNFMGYFNKVVLWGVTPPHTHTHIFRAYYNSLIRMGTPVVWVEDKYENKDIVENRDIVFCHDSNRFIPMNKNAFYVPFSMVNMSEEKRKIFEDHDLCLWLFEFVDQARSIEGAEMWDPITCFSLPKRAIFQPWGSDLSFNYYYDPVFMRDSKDIYWMGSIWKMKEGFGHHHEEYFDRSNWWNKKEMFELAYAIEEQGLNFHYLTGIQQALNADLVQISRFAPSVSGRGQAMRNYLSCRFFKNISYGQFCVTNVPLASELLDGACIYDSNIKNLVQKALDVNEREAISMVKFSQSKISRYNIDHHLFIIALAAKRIVDNARGDAYYR